MARPVKITPMLTKKIAAAIENGCYVETAASYAGLVKSTLYDWLKRGGRALEAAAKGESYPKAEEPFVRFSNAIEKAMAVSENKDLQTIEAHSQGYVQGKTVETKVVDENGEQIGKSEIKTETCLRRDWQAAAWRLERKFPKRWARKPAEVNVGVNVHNNVTLDEATRKAEERLGLDQVLLNSRN